MTVIHAHMHGNLRNASNVKIYAVATHATIVICSKSEPILGKEVATIVLYNHKYKIHKIASDYIMILLV